MRRRVLATLLVLFGLAAVLVATLRPVYGTGGTSGDLNFPRTYQEFLYHDIFRNVLLFAPFGAGMAARGMRAVVALPLGVGVSGSVELAQRQIPGRNAGLHDVASNGVGTLLGFALLQILPGWLRPTRAVRRRLVLGAGAGAAVVFLATSWLFQPFLVDTRWAGSWAPRLWYRGQYGGRVLSSSIDGVALTQDSYANLSAVREHFRGNFTLELELQAGKPPEKAAPLFLLTGTSHVHLIELSVRGEDLLLGFQNRGKRMGFQTAQLYAFGALQGVTPGEELRLTLERRDAEYCFDVAERRSCGHGFTVGDAWKFFLAPTAERVRGWGSGLASAWVALVCLPLGLWGRREACSGAACAVTLAGLLCAPLFGGVLATPLLQIAAVGIGVGAGAVLRRVFRVG